MLALAFGLALCVGGVWAPAARAETLKEALNATYKFNPRLDAARAIQRATDEEVPRALSGYRPSITGSADTSYQLQTIKPTPGSGGFGDTNEQPARLPVGRDPADLPRLPHQERGVGGGGHRAGGLGGAALDGELRCCWRR